jgi:hypothetical protein
MLKRNTGDKYVTLELERARVRQPALHREEALRALRVLENINRFQDNQSLKCVTLLKRFIDSR